MATELNGLEFCGVTYNEYLSLRVKAEELQKKCDCFENEVKKLMDAKGDTEATMKGNRVVLKITSVGVEEKSILSDSALLNELVAIGATKVVLDTAEAKKLRPDLWETFKKVTTKWKFS